MEDVFIQDPPEEHSWIHVHYKQESTRLIYTTGGKQSTQQSVRGKRCPEDLLQSKLPDELRAVSSLGLDPSEGLSHLCPHALESAHSHNQLL